MKGCTRRPRNAAANRAAESLVSDRADGSGNRHAGQSVALKEGTKPDGGEAVGSRDARKILAENKGIILDAGDGAGNRDAGNTGFFLERQLSDGGDRQAIGNSRDDHSPSSPGVTGDGDSIVAVYDVLELSLHRCRRRQEHQNDQAVD